MRRKHIIVVACAAMVVTVICVVSSTSPYRKEPVYGGKTLTAWLKQLDDGEAFGISSGGAPMRSTRQLEAANAIRAIGAEALPLLMQDIHASPDENSARMRIFGRLNAIIHRLTGLWLFLGDQTEEDRIRWRAAQGLAVLGPVARPAIPELKRLLFTNYFHSSIKEAAYVLATLGPEGVEILTNAVQPQTEWSGMCAIWALGQHPEAGTNVIPFLLSATRSSSEGTACGAIQVLGSFHVDGTRVIPVLTNALTSKNPAVSRDAARALGKFGAEAASAVPFLQLFTNDPAAGSDAQEALQKIQPATRK